MTVRKYLSALVALALLLSWQGAHAAGLPDFSDLAAKCGPAVVNINTERKASSGDQDDMFGEMFRNLPPGFEKFFDQFGMRGGKRPQMRQKSLGSGFIISEDGYIVTNNHVVADADVIRVTLDQSTGKSEAIPAKLIGADEETDLALLKVEVKKPLPFLTFGDSAALKVGDWLLAIGNPFGLDHTVTAGILSAKNRNIHAGPFDNFLQTDASINPGNSGGPLLNLQGQVIGINTAIIASGQGIGFAIPSNMASNIINQIKSGKKVSRGWIGVTIQDVDEGTSKALGLGEAKGALVGSVMEGEPAAKAGMKDGDIILRVDGKDIADAAALLRAIADKAPGSKAAIVVWRDGKTREFTVTLGERKSSLTAVKGGKDGQSEGQLGIAVRPLTDEERRELKLDAREGLLIVDVDQNKPAAEADLRPGDVILKANLKPVSSAQALSQIVNDEGLKRGAVMLQISRRGDVYFRTVTLGK
ncbi:DegQ family serine endoprotease [Desulfovibrio legallii]|uniref:Probable periplasmic serine endoprotease DegP-like n=1 Tax=Desulfovibrio legallii TaxID=571438 RepID=A0A1G7QRY5_9BACT|nr:DegQ family serine endoprotease [Desulfovibrio legallii]SDG01275.1 serine protease Do [Desulfovibrio legallii]